MPRIIEHDCEINYAYMKSLTEDLTVTCDEVIDAVAKSYNNISETVLINSNSNKETYKMDYYI